jgi:hypothetical protein
MCWLCFAFHITKSINHNGLEVCLGQCNSAILPHWRFRFDSRGLHFPILWMIQFCSNEDCFLVCKLVSYHLNPSICRQNNKWHRFVIIICFCFHWQWDYPMILIDWTNCSKTRYSSIPDSGFTFDFISSFMIADCWLMIDDWMLLMPFVYHQLKWDFWDELKWFRCQIPKCKISFESIDFFFFFPLSFSFSFPSPFHFSTFLVGVNHFWFPCVLVSSFTNLDILFCSISDCDLTTFIDS